MQWSKGPSLSTTKKVWNDGLKREGTMSCPWMVATGPQVLKLPSPSWSELWHPFEMPYNYCTYKSTLSGPAIKLNHKWSLIWQLPVGHCTEPETCFFLMHKVFFCKLRFQLNIQRLRAKPSFSISFFSFSSRSLWLIAALSFTLNRLSSYSVTSCC